MFYPINEIFQTIQCEGFYSGVPSIFIRLQRCPIRCSWCDTKYTWIQLKNKKTSINNIISKITPNNTWSFVKVEQIIQIIKDQNWTAKHIVITGGEPAIFDLTPLTEELELHGFKNQIETSGTHEIKCSENSWVTVSPKINQSRRYYPLIQALNRSNEIKHLVENNKNIEILDELLIMIKNDKKTRIISLQPINKKKLSTKLCIEICTIRNWRLSIQIHKYININ